MNYVYKQKSFGKKDNVFNRKLKILVLVEDYLPICGGVTSVVHSTALALKDHAEITIGAVVAAKKRNGACFKDSYEGFDVFRCKGFYNPITTNMEPLVTDLKFKKLIESKEYDIIHCHFPLTFFKYAKKIAKQQDIPVVITAHSILYKDIKKAIKLKGLASLITKTVVSNINTADSVWTVSNYAKNFLSNFGLRKDTKVMLNAISKPEKTQNIDIFKKYNIPKNKFTILSVNRLIKIKNVELILKAISLLDLPLTYIVIGKGPQEQYLKKLAKTLNITDKVFFIGEIPQKDLNPFYENADLVSFTSIGDSCGLIQYEASCFKKPTLAIENTAVAEQIIDGYNGFLTKDDPKICAKKIAYCINNPNLVKKCGEKAKETLFRTYDEPKMINYLLNSYKQVIYNYKYTAERKLSKVGARKVKKQKKAI